MQITVQVKLKPTIKQIELLRNTAYEYINLVNSIVSDNVNLDIRQKLTSKDVVAALPSALKNQAIRDANSVFAKYKKALTTNNRLPLDKQKDVRVPILKKPMSIWNNQNFSFDDETISFPVIIDGNCKKIKVRAVFTDYQKDRLKGIIGSLRITIKGGKYIAQIAVEVPETECSKGNVMGVDLGLKIPAAAVTETGKTRFFGNGRKNKYIKRMNLSRRKNLGKAKKLYAIKKFENKEQRWMKDQDHKLSRQIVNFAMDKNIATIKLEKLSGIRQTARTSRKNNHNLHTWSFYRLAQYIEYKAKLLGVKVEYVDPKYTSQACPICATLNKAKDRKYSCGCGYKSHRDRVGAMNIVKAPLADGNSLLA